MNTNTNQEKEHKEIIEKEHKEIIEKEHKEIIENIRDIIENIKEFEEEFKDYLVPGVYFDYEKFFQEARKIKRPIHQQTCDHQCTDPFCPRKSNNTSDFSDFLLSHDKSDYITVNVDVLDFDNEELFPKKPEIFNSRSFYNEHQFIMYMPGYNPGKALGYRYRVPLKNVISNTQNKDQTWAISRFFDVLIFPKDSPHSHLFLDIAGYRRIIYPNTVLPIKSFVYSIVNVPESELDKMCDIIIYRELYFGYHTKSKYVTNNMCNWNLKVFEPIKDNPEN